MTTVYVNGKKVAKEDLKNFEIKNEKVKRLLSGAADRSERKSTAEQGNQTDKDSEEKHSIP